MPPRSSHRQYRGMSARLARCGKTGRPPGGARAQETRKSHGCSAASTGTANRQKCQTCTQSAREPWIRKEHEIRHGVLAETQLDGLRPANPLGRYPCPLANAIPIQQRTAPFHDAFGRRRAPQSAHKARNRPVRRFFWLGGTSPLTRPKRQPLRACTQATGLVKQDGYLGFLIAGHGGGGSRACGAGGTCRVPTGGSTGSPKGGQGDGTSPPRGGRFGPLWGPFDQEEGGPRRRRGGTPQGCPVPGSGIVDNLGYPQPFLLLAD